MSLFAQHGYGKSDKIDRGIEENLISGVIFSPKNEKPENLEEIIADLKLNHPNCTILLDPQFYINSMDGDINQGQLPNYKKLYFDDVSKKSLSIPSNITEYVKQIFEYQNSLKLKRFLSPTIMFRSFDSRWSQISISLANESIKQINDYDSVDLYISLCIGENAFCSSEEVKDFLDLISLFNVKGFYIVIDRKNIENPNTIEAETLSNILYFLYVLAYVNQYDIILGYTDMIGIPLYTTGISTIANGWFNTLKRFSEYNFIASKGGRRPNKRYTSSKILDSILIIPELQTIDRLGHLSKVLSGTKYDNIIQKDLSGDTWSDTINCLHNWSSIKKIMDEIDRIPEIKMKVDFILKKIREAWSILDLFSSSTFDKPKSVHLKSWYDGLKEFKKSII